MIQYRGSEEKKEYNDAKFGQFGVELLKDDITIGYILLQDTDGGWDYTLLTIDCLEADGGVYEDVPTVLDVIKNIIEDMEDLISYNHSFDDIPNGYVFVGYNELLEEYENYDICRNWE